MSIYGFIFSSLTTLYVRNYDKNYLIYYNISMVLNINLLQFPTLYVINYVKNYLKYYNISMVLNINLLRHIGLKGQNWKEEMNSAHLLLQKSKVFNISNASVSQ